MKRLRRARARQSPSRRRVSPSMRLVRDLRTWLDVTEDQLARLIGYQARSVSKWEQGHPMAAHAVRALRSVDSLRERLIRQKGWSGSRKWLRTPQVVLGGSTPLVCLQEGRLDAVLVAAAAPDQPPADMEASQDPNYQAFLQDAPLLAAAFPGHMVAYAAGARVAVAKGPRELLGLIPPEYSDQPLFIKDVENRVVQLRRPLRVIDR